MDYVLSFEVGSADEATFLPVKSDSVKGGDTQAGIRKASDATESVIASDGIILAGTFAALALSPLRSLVQVGLAVSTGIVNCKRRMQKVEVNERLFVRFKTALGRT